MCGARGRDVVSGAPRRTVCRDPACRKALERAARMATGPARRYVARRGGEINRARSERARRRSETRALEARERLEDEAHLRRAATARGTDPPPPLLVLPSGRKRLQNLAERRRRGYRDFLTDLIQRTVAGEREAPGWPFSDEPLPGDELHGTPIQTHACTVCAGGCCPRGGDTAFLDVTTIRRFMRTHPRMRPRHVLAAYLDRLASRTYEGSCINHTPQGCSLPRDMRSDVCNDYLCLPLRSLQTGRRSLAPEAFAISRAADKWVFREELPDPAAVDNRIVASAHISEDRIEWHVRADAGDRRRTADETGS